ncbi:MAG TPA: long-chain fatty acid--CoA ligase [Candidatus Limnocylindrales bacterium]|nr:long-chain fatty acid--CoA ligase [Candidatus Limnocylindrales bacterium]
MNLASAFAASVEKRSEKIAIYWGETELSYAVVFGQVCTVVAALTGKLGVKPGDRVALWMKNCPEFVPAVFGILSAGGVVVPINNFLKPAEVSYILNDSGANVVITDSELSAHFPELAAARPLLKMLKVEEFAGRGSAESHPSRSGIANRKSQIVDRMESDLAALLYTSGTTGHPKGAMLTHGNFLHNVASCVEALKVQEDERVIVALPQFHSFMFTVGTLLPMVCGAGILLLKTLHPFKQVLEDIARHRGTILPAVPSFYRALLAVPEFGKLPLRLCISGGAPLPVEVFNEFTRRFPFPLREGYGPTESSPVATVNPIYGTNKPGSIGKPIPNVELSIRDEAGKELAVGATGEICIRGGNVMRGYWNQPEETAKVLRDGWLYTGDVGYCDADGYYFITDRKKDMLLVNGINVYPREIEEIIYQFPGVKEAAVVGVPDPRKGEQPVAFVSAVEGQMLDEAALLQFVRSKLADYKVPKRVIFMPLLPRNTTGKILKTTLRQHPLS